MLPEFQRLYTEFDPEGALAVWGEWEVLAQKAIAKAEGKYRGKNDA